MSASGRSSSGGGGAAVATQRARVYQSGGNTIALANDGSVIMSRATSAANNVLVIQAAIDAVAGAYTPGNLTTLGHGGGGVVELSDQLYDVSAAIDLKYGVNLRGSCNLDRNGFIASAHSYQGTVLAPTNALASINIAASGAAVTRTPVLLLGRTQAANGVQSTTNPHGVTIEGIGIDMRRKNTAQGIVIADTQFVTVQGCQIGDALQAGGVAIEVISTNSPDDGAHGTYIHDCLLVNCERGVAANGSGSTDSLLSDCRILQMGMRTIEVGASGGGGGWQISGCHLTAGTGAQLGVNDAHIYVSGAPAVITGNYIDTTGGLAIYVDSPMAVISGNYIKMASTKVAPIYLDGNGRKSIVVSNTCQGSATCKGLVQVSSTAGQDYRPVVMGNILGDGGVAPIVGIVLDAAGAAVAETNAAMTVARDGTPNPYIFGNRIVASAV